MADPKVNLPPLGKQAIVVACVTLLAVLLNGATSPFLRLLTIALMAAAILIAPPLQRPGKWFAAVAIGLIAVSCVAFLPAGWFTTPPWRVAASEIGLDLPTTVSPQPGLSAQAVLILTAGLAWLYYLSAKNWDRHERKRLCEILAATSILIGAAYIACKSSGTRWPGAAYADQFGPFPNKNQTASVLMLGAILTVGLLNLRGGSRRGRKLLWAGGLLLLVAALFAVGSRTAIVLFVVASLIASLRRATLPGAAIAASALMLMAATGVLGKSELLSKFTGNSGVVDTTASNGRWSLYADSFAMLGETPITGTGIGNFEDAFALHRDRSSTDNRALHPDSDLVWTFAEIGVPGALIAGALVLAAFSFVLPLKKRSANTSRRDHSLRMTCLIAAIAFATNAVIDVPAHRLGSLLPGLLVLALAFHPRRRLADSPSAHRFALTTCAALPVIGLLLLANPARPLDAHTYFSNAQTHLRAGELSAAAADFEKARFLRPAHAKLPLAEGNLWLAHSPMRAVAAWRECLERASRLGRTRDYFNEIYKLSADHPELQDELWLLAHGKPELQTVSLRRSRRDLLGELLESNPDLIGWNHSQISIALEQFARHRSDADLLDLIDRHPNWAPLCWRPFSQALASQGEHDRAFQVISAACPVPDLSVLHSNLSLAALRTEHLRSPDNLTATIRLAHQHMRRGNTKRALEMLQKIATPEKQTPPIVHFMIAHCLARESDHEQAHQALLGYVEMVE